MGIIVLIGTALEIVPVILFGETPERLSLSLGNFRHRIVSFVKI